MFPVSVVVLFFFFTLYELLGKQTLTSRKCVPRRGKRGRVLHLVKEEGGEFGLVSPPLFFRAEQKQKQDTFSMDLNASCYIL